jgi:hypothetical protein
MDDKILDNFSDKKKNLIPSIVQTSVMSILGIAATFLAINHLTKFFPPVLYQIGEIKIYTTGLMRYAVLIVCYLWLCRKLFHMDNERTLGSFFMGAIVGAIFFVSELIYGSVISVSILSSGNSAYGRIFQMSLITGLLLGMMATLFSWNKIQGLRNENRVVSGILIILLSVGIAYFSKDILRFGLR